MAKNDFKEIPLSPLNGFFDVQSPASDADFTRFSLVKNLAARGTNKRCRRGGWERLFAEVTPYNNQDLHDQLVSEQVYGTLTTISSYGGGGLVGLNYPYFFPPYSNAAYNYVTFGSSATCAYYPRFGLTGSFDLSHCFTTRWHIGWPYTYHQPFYDSCNSGSPQFYSYSYYYLDCPWTWPPQSGPGYYTGAASGIYEPYFSSFDSYCTPSAYTMPGCSEAITHLTEVSVEGSSRRLIASTMSRIYALNESSGNWKLLAQGLGNAAYTNSQCGCNDVRFTSAIMGAYALLTNNFDPPLLWFIGDDSSQTCEDAARPIGDLEVLGITAAGGAVSWKGFMILFDILENGARHGGKIAWSDFEDPTSWIPSDVSLAGEATVAPGERFLSAQELGNFLYLYSDRSIWRVTLLDSNVLFSFDKVYSGNAALKYRHSMVNTGKSHVYLGQNHIYVMTLFDTRPIELDWLNKVSPVIYSGMNEPDASFGPINELACDQAIGGWNEEFKEVWFSWPTGNNQCPNQSLVLNMQYSMADLVDHGFTAFKSFRPDSRPTIDDFLVDNGICSEQEIINHLFREGLPCNFDKIGTVSLIPLLNATLPLWDVISGTIDLIGTNSDGVSSFDLIPGNGLYVDLAGSPGRGTIRTKSTFTFTTAHNFQLVIYLAGNHRVAATDIVTVTAGAILSSIATVTNYQQGFTKYIFNFTGNGSTGKISIGFTGGTQLSTTDGGPLLSQVYFRDSNTNSILFYDNFDSVSPVAPSTLTIANATTSILNETENLALPADPNSLCARLAGLTEDDFCKDCGVITKFVMADAVDFTLKQYSDTIFYRESFSNGYVSTYTGQSCDSLFYYAVGYDTVLQSGSQDFRTDNEKTVKRITAEVDPLPQTTPSNLEAFVGYSSQGSCPTWVALPPQQMRCLSDLTVAQQLARGIRPDRRLHFPTFYRGRFLSWRLKISGIGGGACISEIIQVVKGSELNTSR